MPLEAKLIKHLQKELELVDDRGTTGPRLVGDARRLLRRVERLIGAGAVAAVMERDALELSCYAVQLPMRLVTGSRLGVLSLKDRCEQAAELMVMTLAEQADEQLLDRSARLIHETPQRNPVLDEAKLLADALNLDDFGISGLLRQAIRLGVLGQGVEQVVEAMEKRSQYGYLEARLKEHFHFDASRAIARSRLAAIEPLFAGLREEMD